MTLGRSRGGASPGGGWDSWWPPLLNPNWLSDHAAQRIGTQVCTGKIDGSHLRRLIVGPESLPSGRVHSFPSPEGLPTATMAHMM